MNDDIVYFGCNDWYPEPKESERLVYEYLEKDAEKFAIDNKLCIKIDIVDMSISYYITAKRSFFEEKFLELLPLIKNEPYDFLFKGDKELFLEYKEENIGVNYEI